MKNLKLKKGGRSVSRRTLFAALAGGAAAAGLTVWRRSIPALAKGPAGPVPASASNTFTHAYLWPTKTIDPHGPGDNPNLIAVRPMYEALVDYKPGSLELEPVLASSWLVSPDNRKYTFKLRQGVRFHDGAVLDAAAVKKSYERMLKLGKAPAAALQRFIKDIETPDPSTLVVNMSVPYAPTLATLGGTLIVSPKAIDEHAGGDDAQGWLSEHSAGTGPYVFKRWERSQSLTMTKFPVYWRGWSGKHIDTVVIMYVEEQATQRQLVQRGEVEMAMAIAANDLAQLKDDQNLRVYADLSIRQYLIRLDNRRPPLNDQNFRQAITYAFDYKSAVEQILVGNGLIARGYVPTRYVTHDNSLPPETFNLAKAKQLLEASSYPKGTTFTCTYIGNLDLQRAASELWQANLAKIGVTLKLNPQPWAVMVERSTRPETRDNCGWFAFNYGNKDETFAQWQTLSSKTNAAWGNYGYKNDEIERLLDRGLVTVDDAARTKLLHQAQRLAREDSATVNAWIFKDWVVARRNVKGYVYDPGYPTIPRFYDMYVE